LRVEGNYPNTVGGTAFARDTSLFYSPQFLTILIQVNKPVFTGGDSGKYYEKHANDSEIEFIEFP
jgi:hypothetical protein